MRVCLGRRLIALLTVLLSLGLVSHGTMAADMNAKMMPAAAVEMPMSQDCDACGGNGDMAETVCDGVCNSSAAVLPHLVPARVIALAQSNGQLESAQTSRRIAPDPSPPKSLLLS